MNRTRDETRIIPRPAAVRVELARSVRESRRLRSLLRVAIAAEQDIDYVDSLSRSGGICRHEAASECAGLTVPTSA